MRGKLEIYYSVLKMCDLGSIWGLRTYIEWIRETQIDNNLL